MKPMIKGDAQEDLFRFSKEQQYVVAQRNDLIQRARHELTTKELKLVDFMISKIRAEDEDLYEVETTIQEINETMDFGKGGEQYEDTCQALLNLRNKGFFIEMTDNTDYGDKKPIVTTSWLAKAQINPDKTCILRLDEDLVPYLINLVGEGHYTQFYLREILTLKSKYSLMLYRLAKSFSHLDGFGDVVEEFKAYFGKEEDPWNQFNQKYLKPAVKEINSKTSMTLEVKAKKSGRVVKEVFILVNDSGRKKFAKKKEEQPPARNDEWHANKDKPKVPLYNWLEGHDEEAINY